jgi:hypothetical protein
VEFEFPNEIPTLPSGKHQYAISELNRSWAPFVNGCPLPTSPKSWMHRPRLLSSLYLVKRECFMCCIYIYPLTPLVIPHLTALHPMFSCEA